MRDRGTLGDRAERIAEERIRAALPGEARCYANVRFVARTRPTGPAHDGEADLVIVHPEHGLLVIEVKSGEPSRDGQDRWFIGGKQLARSPLQAGRGRQARPGRRDRRAPGCHRRRAAESRPRRGASRTRTSPASPRATSSWDPTPRDEIILDAAALADVESTKQALERAWAWWTGDGTRGRPLTQAQAGRIHEYLAPTVALHRLIRRDVEDGRDRLVDASRAQRIVLNQNRSSAAGDRGAGGERQEPRGRGAGAPPRARGLPHPLRVLQPAAGHRGGPRDRRGR